MTNDLGIGYERPTQEQLDGWVAEWQKVLRLQDWMVVIELRRQSQIDDDRNGEIVYTLGKKSAHIAICDPNDRHPHTVWSDDRDVELTVVHELLHLHFAPFDAEDRNSPEATAQEQAINLISEALIALKRAVPQSPSPIVATPSRLPTSIHAIAAGNGR